MRSCPALFICAPASGQGKTTLTAALARHHRDRGERVRVFKAGPDFLDPLILERASASPVYQLDLWMGDEAHCRQLLYDAAGEADLILIEGAMGLFDGDPSSGDLAARFAIPVLTLIDACAMAQTFGAVAHGLATYREDVPFAGVFANRVAGEGHFEMLAESLPPGLSCLGWLPGDPAIALPERHLGLVQADEISDLDSRIAKAAAALNGVDEAAIAPASFTAPGTRPKIPTFLEGVRVAVARDPAFSFLYRANLDVLRQLGAVLSYFSPLADRALPDTDALYLPGGYPELHLDALAGNEAMKKAVRAHHEAGKPIVAECGGLLYLLESLADARGHCAPMAGLLPGRAAVQERLANLGLHRARLPEGELRGHTFHHSVMEGGPQPVTRTRAARHHGTREPVYRDKRLTATYMHFYFPSGPETAARLFLP